MLLGPEHVHASVKARYEGEDWTELTYDVVQ